MGIRIALSHRTRYDYDRSIRLGPQLVRLRPAPHCRSPILSYSLKVRPESHFVNWQQDPWGNHVARFVFPEPTGHLQIDVDLVADLTVVNPFDFFLEPDHETYPLVYPEALRRQLEPSLERLPGGPRFDAYLAAVDRSPRSVVDFLVDLNARVQRDLQYEIRYESGLQTPEQTLEMGRGACRDFAWLLVQLFRSLGIAARFVSGYSVQLVADEKPLEGPAGVSQDVVDLHAWAEAYLPGAGWVGFDATSGMLAGEGHIPLACSPDPESAAPVSGALDACETTFDVSMSVSRLREEPRSSRPYREEQWEEILACGEEVDARLREGDVRLTMGGEPTFVSVDDFVGEEWTTGAVGPDKRLRAEELIRRLRRRFAPGGVLHYGQGKWYPGESLPRWALGCYWRADGEPIWRDDRWLAEPTTPASATEADAEAFAAALAERLGLEVEHVLPAYEDTAYYLWREGRLPVDVDPTDPGLSDPEERARLAQVFTRGLGTPVGFVLPLARDVGGQRWRSELWMLRGRHLRLTPGDSPVGLRLPLESLPPVDDGALDFTLPADPTAPRAALPPRPRRAQPAVQRTAAPEAAQAVSEQPSPSGSGEAAVRTALSVEPRDGRLHVFLPPVTHADDFVDLLEGIEDVAALLERPVVLEGYAPPSDPRLRSIKVTPDPGVIEVNVHPASSWAELVDITTGTYEDARQTRLGPERFLVDGRRVGTGGGNHMTLGGPTPLDSPFLRRPALLRSLLTCWNNHPSLSYLLSSLFIGPTSQHPRTDEARPDQLYELEIAFALAGREDDAPPWHVDRLFRDLLVDSSGNTHRAEFCIDKLYSPDTVTGRLGLLELRSMEMPPHARMSVAQQLLVRALVARFWDEPQTDPLVRWGTELHDRFMLPHWVSADLEDVLGDLRDHGLELKSEWFVPHVEFRFPRIGSIEHAGVEIELRHALEPWHVLGEDPGAGGTVRYVDSSLERVQVRVSGMTDTRHLVACNGRRLPLRPTGTRGEFVCGVRFRAWQPPRCLHPTIPVHAPLVFDLVDTWAGRSVGGCTYHVGHPGGRNYDEPPVNAFEAEARRRARFEPIGHTPGPLEPAEIPPHPEAPWTLDLRRG